MATPKMSDFVNAFEIFVHNSDMAFPIIMTARKHKTEPTAFLPNCGLHPLWDDDETAKTFQQEYPVLTETSPTDEELKCFANMVHISFLCHRNQDDMFFVDFKKLCEIDTISIWQLGMHAMYASELNSDLLLRSIANSRLRYMRQRGGIKIDWSNKK